MLCFDFFFLNVRGPKNTEARRDRANRRGEAGGGECNLHHLHALPPTHTPLRRGDIKQVIRHCAALNGVFASQNTRTNCCIQIIYICTTATFACELLEASKSSYCCIRLVYTIHKLRRAPIQDATRYLVCSEARTTASTYQTMLKYEVFRMFYLSTGELSLVILSGRNETARDVHPLARPAREHTRGHLAPQLLQLFSHELYLWA